MREGARELSARLDSESSPAGTLPRLALPLRHVIEATTSAESSSKCEISAA
jgi:hypothetical protein